MPDWWQIAAAGIVFVGLGLWVWVRREQVNKTDPLQFRLSGHLETYLRSAQDDTAKEALIGSIKSEFRQRQLPREEWSHRFMSAVALVDRDLAQQHSDALIRLSQDLLLKWNA